MRDRDQRDHLHGLRVVADHALHELDVGGGGLDLRQVGGLRRADGLGVLSRRAGLKDLSGGRGAAAGRLAGRR